MRPTPQGRCRHLRLPGQSVFCGPKLAIGLTRTAVRPPPISSPPKGPTTLPHEARIARRGRIGLKTIIKPVCKNAAALEGLSVLRFEVFNAYVRTHSCWFIVVQFAFYNASTSQLLMRQLVRVVEHSYRHFGLIVKSLSLSLPLSLSLSLVFAFSFFF